MLAVSIADTPEYTFVGGLGLCTKSDTLSGVFVQDGILHKKVKHSPLWLHIIMLDKPHSHSICLYGMILYTNIVLIKLSWLLYKASIF